MLARDPREPHREDTRLVEVFRAIYDDPERNWDVYETCEELVDVEDNFQLWRFRHLKTVERTIGFRTGTGGTTGASFLRRVLDLTFFPELYAVRTAL
jgi:tryptophan 2,3-dioxygenase